MKRAAAGLISALAAALFTASPSLAQPATAEPSAPAPEAAEAPAGPQAEAPAVEAPPAEPPAPKTGPVEEVQVRGRKGTKAGQTSFTAQEVREVPGAFGDAFRVMEALPGVTPMMSGLPFFFVRGAPPGNNGYFLDGVRIPLLYHVGAGPSVIHPGLVDKVDFYPGGYPARYGRFAGGVLAGESRRPAAELHGEGNIRIFDAGALVETPFADGRGTALVAGRYSYTAAIISLAAPQAVLDYWDYQGRVTWALTPKDTIGVFAFGAYDFFGEKRPSGEVRTALATQFHRIDTRWDHDLPNRGHMRLALTVGSDETGTDELRGVKDRMIGARLYVEQPLGEDVLLRGGSDVMLDHYDLDTSRRSGGVNGNSNVLYPPRNDLVAGVHLDAVMQAAPRWEVTPGVRFDYYESVRNFEGASRTVQRRSANAAVPAVDPRLLSRLKLGKDVTLVSTFGLSHQPPAFFIPIPGLQIGRLSQGLQTSVQVSQGFEIQLPWKFTLTPTFFHHQYLGLTDFATTCGETANLDDGGGGTVDDDCVDRRVRGKTLGLEILLRRSLTQKLTGWLSYTLSRTTRTTQLSTVADLAGLYDGFSRRSRAVSWAEIPSDFDRTHVLNLIGAYDLGRGWRTGARFYFYSGRPYSRQVSGIPIPPFNQQRFPDFYRFDLRLEKRWQVGQKGRISFVVEWLNATLSKEALSVDCPYYATPSQAYASTEPCRVEEIGPVTIPSLGVEGSF
ncbi:MAG: TonB-dependent receptor [Labilithrix sp.]|nr:TonB-dependent receptor [Labilithrix sp.]